MKSGGKVIFITGPTAVGKTETAIALAKEVRGEIISADSMQAYRGMDIMSQKPSPRQRAAAPHHLIDILDIRQEYSAADFAGRAERLIRGIIYRKGVPIVTGGSGLYIKALIDGLFPAPKKDVTFREGLEAEARAGGTGPLHKRLESVDPEAASKIHPNDLRRIIRALEVFHLTGAKISEERKRTKGIKDDFDIAMYGLTRPRDIIYKRIDERVDAMFADGLIDEVRRIKKRGPGMTAAGALGYKEVSGYLDGKYSPEEAERLLRKNTKRFAKRQLTWFRPDRRIAWIDIEMRPVAAAVKDIAKGV